MSYKRKEVIGDCTLYLGDCMEVMPFLDKVDAVVTDPPYGTTVCKWDSIIPFEKMWVNIDKVSNINTPIVLFGSQPFTSKLICSNINSFKYEWIWQKAVGSNFAAIKYQPMKEHENIIIFSKGTHNYYPIMQDRNGTGAERIKSGYKATDKTTGETTGSFSNIAKRNISEKRIPSSVQFFNNRKDKRGYHPTQKPIDLMAYLVETYTKESETVLDFTMGSGTTGVACVKMGRKFIGIELDEGYFDIACQRIRDAYAQPDMLLEAGL